MSFEIGVFDYLINNGEKFLFVKSFDVVYVLELIEKGLGLFWDDLKAREENLHNFEILQNSRPMISFISNDQFHVQYLVLRPMINFESNDQF